MNKAEQFRYERKFFITSLSLPQVELQVKLHQKAFFPLFYPRWINNIYFDTPGFTHYHDNNDGEKNRLKVRIRWYGDLFQRIEGPVLEFKIKEGLVGRKESYNLKSFDLNDSFDMNKIKQVVKESNLPARIVDYVSSLQPAIMNRYNRKYFISFDKEVRLTIDSGLNFLPLKYSCNFFVNKIEDHSAVIVELKYNTEADKRARDLGAGFSFPLTKSSKYLQGLERFIF